MPENSERTIWLESETGEQISFQESCVLGRSKQCQIVVDNEKASRRHAMIHRQGTLEHWLVDLGSANGTLLNGRRVTRPSRLSNGDKIKVAGVVFIFRQKSSPGARTEESPSTIDGTVANIERVDCWLLVVDMVGSTQLKQDLGDREALALIVRPVPGQADSTADQHQGPGSSTHRSPATFG